jgi:hypothetical protein
LGTVFILEIERKIELTVLFHDVVVVVLCMHGSSGEIQWHCLICCTPFVFCRRPCCRLHRAWFHAAGNSTLQFEPPPVRTFIHVLMPYVQLLTNLQFQGRCRLLATHPPHQGVGVPCSVRVHAACAYVRSCASLCCRQHWHAPQELAVTWLHATSRAAGGGARQIETPRF